VVWLSALALRFAVIPAHTPLLVEKMAALTISAPIVARAGSFAGRKVATKATNGTGKTSMRAVWMPGSEAPAHLDGSLPCDYGFDPLGLGKEPAQLARFQEAEIMHCRWAMLGVAGAAAQEIVTGVNWIQAPVQDSQTYLGNSIPFPLPVVVGIQIFVMSYLEQKRTDQTDPVKRLYPGGAFDPAGFSKGADFEKLKRKEIANGRLAMVAFAGIIGQAQATANMGPVAALQAHLADPWHVNAATNAAAVPYL
jgi:light-harvesting complex I chlorophyll a/b binding protein 1